MITTIIVVVPAVLVASLLGVGVILREVRRNRRMINARLDAQGEALRLIAELNQVELPPETPRKPEFKLYKGGLAVLALLVATIAAWTGQHLRTVATATVGATAVLGAAVAGVLLFSSGPGSGTQRALPLASLPAPAAPWSAIPHPSQSATASTALTPSATTASAPGVYTGAAPARMHRAAPTTGPGQTGPPGPSVVPSSRPTRRPSPSASAPVPGRTCAAVLDIDLPLLARIRVCL